MGCTSTADEKVDTPTVRTGLPAKAYSDELEDKQGDFPGAESIKARVDVVVSKLDLNGDGVLTEDEVQDIFGHESKEFTGTAAEVTGIILELFANDEKWKGDGHKLMAIEKALGIPPAPIFKKTSTQKAQEAKQAMQDKLQSLGHSDLNKEYANPSEEVWVSAMKSEDTRQQFENLAALLMKGLDGVDGVEDGVISLNEHTIRALPVAMYKGGIFGTSAVDAEKDAYLKALVLCFAEDHAKNMKWRLETVQDFLKFLFESRTLLAASFINRGCFGGGMTLREEPEKPAPQSVPVQLSGTEPSYQNEQA